LTVPETGIGECSSRFTGKCQVRHPARALSLQSRPWHLELEEGGTEKGKKDFSAFFSTCTLPQ
jgi:hypothetical protein